MPGLKALNVERNHCAHNARIWNRGTTHSSAKINPRLVDTELHHLEEADQNEAYSLAAVVVHRCVVSRRGRASPATSERR